MNQKNKIAMVALCAMSLGGCMTEEELAQYRVEQQQRKMLLQKQAVDAELRMVAALSDEARLTMIVLGTRPEDETDGHMKFRWWVSASYSKDAKVAAAKRLTTPEIMWHCALAEVVSGGNGKRDKFSIREESDPVRQVLISNLCVKVDYEKLGRSWGSGCELSDWFGMKCGNWRKADSFGDECTVLDPQLHHGYEKYPDDVDRGLYNYWRDKLILEVLAHRAKKDACRWIKKNWHSTDVNCTEFLTYMNGADESDVVEVFSEVYGDGSWIRRCVKDRSDRIQKVQKLLKSGNTRISREGVLRRYDFYGKVSAEDLNPQADPPELVFIKQLYSSLRENASVKKVLHHIALQHNSDEEYDFAFEKELIIKHRDKIIEMFGDDASLYPEGSNLARFASLLHTDEERKAKRAKALAQRGAFNGVFGKRFGDVMPTDEGVRVTKFGADFYRVPFEPAKKSEAFTHYYVWLTPSSHKIFEIEARSDSALAFSRTEVEYKDKEGNARKYQRNAAKPDVVFALEKKYCEYFMKQGEAYVLQFPEEKCHLSVIPNLAGAIAGGGRSGFVDLFMMNTFGFTADHEQEEKKIRRLKDYNFSSVEEKTRALVFAESAELYKLAKEETNAERTKQKKAAADKQKAAAQNAADAF